MRSRLPFVLLQLLAYLLTEHSWFRTLCNFLQFAAHPESCTSGVVGIPYVTLLICIKKVQARITKSSLWATPRTLVFRDNFVPLIDWSSTQTRQSCCGPVQRTVCHYLMVVVRVCVLEMTPRLPASTSVFLVSPSRLTSVWISMSAVFVQQDFSDFDNSDVFGGHLILTRLRHSSMPSCHHAWITAMQSSLGRRRM